MLLIYYRLGMFKTFMIFAAALLFASCNSGANKSAVSEGDDHSDDDRSAEVREERSDFTINTYSYNAIVKADNTWVVTEDITVDFSEPRHGIYREIPLAFDYADELYHANIYDIHVDGFPFTSEVNEQAASIRIGDKDITVNGRQKYVLSYNYHIEGDRIKDGDFLCQSVLGDQWNTTIDNVLFSIKFEKGLPQDFVKSLRVYSGSTGSHSNDVGVKVDVDMATSTIYGTAKDLKPHQAITLSADLPEGYWNK